MHRKTLKSARLHGLSLAIVTAYALTATVSVPAADGQLLVYGWAVDQVDLAWVWNDSVTTLQAMDQEVQANAGYTDVDQFVEKKTRFQSPVASELKQRMITVYEKTKLRF